MRRLAHAALLLLCIIMVTSCQKIAIEDFDDEEETTVGDKVTAKFCISQLEQVPFQVSQDYMARATDIKEVCNHLFLAVYSTSGERKTTKSQNSTDKGFGTFSISLEKGTYRIVILAYNGKDNPTSTDPTKIIFGNNGKMSDMFLWSEDVTIDNNVEKDIILRRAVAAFRLVTTDTIPSNVAKMNFHYTGGSSTLNALTGAGSVASKQDETFIIKNTDTGKTGTFIVYTFPRDDANVLKMEVTALDASGAIVASQTFDDVPITRNKVTEYKGDFFNNTSGASGNISFHISILDSWDGTIEKSF